MRLEQKASELPVPMLSIRQFISLWILLVLLMASSCALTKKGTTRRNHRQLVTSVNDLQQFELYLKEFDQEIICGTEIDMQIVINGLSDVEIYTTFKRISNSVKNNRFIGVIQPGRTFRYRPEGSLIKYDRIKFHVHNCKHDNTFTGTDGISSLEIAITKVPHLAIM